MVVAVAVEVEMSGRRRFVSRSLQMFGLEERFLV